MAVVRVDKSQKFPKRVLSDDQTAARVTPFRQFFYSKTQHTPERLPRGFCHFISLFDFGLDFGKSRDRREQAQHARQRRRACDQHPIHLREGRRGPMVATAV